MRKVLSFVLVLSLVLGSFGMAFAAPLSDVAGKKCEDAVNVLTNLGVVSGYPDGEYKPDQVVTRAEMAVIIVRALGLADYATGTSSFSDMGGHWSNPYVAYATSLGIIDGYPDGTFRPDNTVSYDEAAKMLVAALGYTPESLTGTWPANYVVKAQALGILKGIKAGSAGTNRGDIAVMAYQTLGVKIGSTDKDGKWTANDPVDTMLERLGAKLYDPDETDNALPNPQPGDPFVLTNTHADNAVANVRDFIGAYVTAYANDDYEIIAIKEVKSVFLTGEFDSVTGGLVGNVFEADKDYDVVGDAYYDTNDDEFVNGVAGPLTPSAATEYKIAANVSGVKIKDIYSISVWTVSDDFMFEDGDLEDDNIDGNKFTLDDNDEIDLGSFALIGVDSLEDIDEDNVVYVYSAGTPAKITRIEVGTEVVEGVVTKISSDEKKITVDGKVYEYADENIDALTNAVAKGGVGLEDEVVLYLDVNGYIYDMDVNVKDGGNYGIILETADETAGLNGNAAKVKLFLADGTDEVFDVDIDEVSATSLISAAGAWTTAAKAGGVLVEYGLDSDGVIDYLKDMTADANYNVAPGADKKLTAKLTYNGVPVASDAILFTADVTDPSFDPKDEDFYGVTTVAKAKGSEFKAAYYAKNNKITLMVIQGTGTDTDLVYGVVKSWGSQERYL